MISEIDIKKKVKQVFLETFGKYDAEIFAPGRANIIGEHTDYNNGFVLPFAISQGVYLFAARTENSILNIIAFDVGEKITIDFNDPKDPSYGWEKFIFQVLSVLDKDKIAGFNLVFGGDLPIGGGISSSSALTCGLIALLNDLFKLGMNGNCIVQKSIEAERGYGVRGGIMDQFTIVNAIKNNAILLDCRDNSYTHVPLNLDGHCFYLFNTNVKHNLLHTDYNNRRIECENAVDIISNNYKPITSLRDLDVSDLTFLEGFLDEKLYKRVNFVILENLRVLHSMFAIEKYDILGLGNLLSQSHQGLSFDYEVSCDELDWLVSFASHNSSILGARMMGGGFGGCTINLVKGSLDAIWLDKIKTSYKDKFGIDLTVFPIKSGNGILHNIDPKK